MKRILTFIIVLVFPFMVFAKTNMYDDLINNSLANNQLEKIEDDIYIFKGGTSNNLANYVKFNNELWRIMGIYNNKLKIIRANSIGQHQFDDGSMKITYPDSELSVYLNGSYLNSINANDKKMIDEDGTWYVGNTSNSSKASEAFLDAKKESLTEAVGIMATYEFLYASNGTDCYTINGNSYSNICGKKANNWLTPAEHDSWTLTTYYYNEEHTRGVPLNISPSGYVSFGSGNAASLWIYPALYLKNNTKIVSGTGTSNDPYLLGIYNAINVENDNQNGTFNIEVEDISEVELGSNVKFSITPKPGYEVESLEILDQNNKKVEYKKSNKDNEYTFIMPDTDISIKIKYVKSYEFIEGMGQSFNVVNDSRLRFRVNMEYKDFINGGKVYIDGNVVDEKYYELSEGSTIIIFNDEYSKSLKLGNHEIVTTLSDGSSAKTNFVIGTDTFGGNPNTIGGLSLVFVIIFISSFMIYYLLKNKKKIRKFN